MATNVSASLSSINPNTLFFDGYELSDQSIIPNENIISSFIPFEDKVEYFVYDLNKNLISGVNNFTDYTLAQNPSSNEDNDTSTVELSPINDLINRGIDSGRLYTVYNFIRHQLSSDSNNKYYISEISSDRTELRLKSNTIINEDIITSFQQLKLELDSSDFFDEFYITFGDNQYNIGVNIKLDTTEETYSVLVKLYDALPLNFNIKDEAYVVTKVAESVGYQIEYPEVVESPSDVTFLQGPNTNLDFKDYVNNSTELKSNKELLSSNSSGSSDNLANILNKKGVVITPNYSFDTFSEFINFSSAKKRIENFVDKVEKIQTYESNLNTLSTITGSTSQSFEVSSSVASAYTNIKGVIENFDGYEYFLYYNTGSSSYPKSTSTFPYTLYPTTASAVLDWLGSDIETSAYYGGIALSASLYDENNQNWLYYTIPEFIRENSDNNQYLEFSNMVGQHFDEIWLHTKAVAQKSNTTSDLQGGVPLELADDVIASLGYKGFSNNYNNQDNFIGLLGENDGSYVPPTGSELITDYIAVNNGEALFQYGDFINQHISSSFPYAIDKVSKEIYKRLYHNMAYLTKKKGTISGLRQLINIWGIPSTILRINEFGGKNKDNTDDYDLWYNRYNYAFTPFPNTAFAQAKMPWLPLESNYILNAEEVVPDTIQFRFKSDEVPTTAISRALIAKKSDDDANTSKFDFGIQLTYDPPSTGSYSGAGSSEYENWGTMRLVMSGSSTDGGDAISNDIYLPFFDKGWWSVMLQRDVHVDSSNISKPTTYTLYAANKIDNGWDGNNIGFEGSASIVSNVSTSINEAWNKYGSSISDTSVWLGGYGADGRTIVGNTTIQERRTRFSGSFQEFRYYSQELNYQAFSDYVMNPESIEGNGLAGPNSTFNILNFRAPLGSELESIFTSPNTSGGIEYLKSNHPAIVGSINGNNDGNILTTQSFHRPSSVVDSLYSISYPNEGEILNYSTPNTEVYFLDQPVVGVRNRVSNKIQIDDGQDYGTTLSSLRSIQQSYQVSGSYVENVNNLEVAFSPQEEINDDIIQQFGFGLISNFIGSPEFASSSDDHYPELRAIAEDYFKKYSKSNIYDYLRLIKYFDNSIFKAIKNYVPARTSVSTGIVIKQHLLERNRKKPVQLSEVTKIAVTPSGGLNTPINLENLELTSSIEVGSFSGSTGFVKVDDNLTYITADTGVNKTVLGDVPFSNFTQDGFYDGEISGSNLTVIPSTEDRGEREVFMKSLNTTPNALLSSITQHPIGALDGVYNLDLRTDVVPSSFPAYVSLTVVGGYVVSISIISQDERVIDKLSPGDELYIFALGFPASQGLIMILQADDFTSQPIQTSFNPILNNVSSSRLNSYSMKIEYDQGIETPSNVLRIIDGNAERAETPDSNYTSKKITLPRYEGSKISSADYNHYTSGDVSYGQTATIDKNPIYFAHFDYSWNNPVIFGMGEYFIDQLIEVPFEDIQGEVYNPKVLKIEGNNSKLSEIVSTFEVNRDLAAVYESEIYEGVNYSTLKRTDLEILNPASRYIITSGNQISPTETSPSWSYSRFDETEPFNILENTNQNGVIMMTTGSGCLNLSGSQQTFVAFKNSASFADTGLVNEMTIIGPHLSVIHTYNYCVKNEEIINDNSFPNTLPGIIRPGVTPGIDPDNNNSYFSLNPAKSGLPNYENDEQPFLIERGDEIRVTYLSGSSGYINQDFQVLGVDVNTYNPFGNVGYTPNNYTVYGTSVSVGGAFSRLDIEDGVGFRMFDQIKVSPDPSTLTSKITEGAIYSYTVRKRQDADNIVNIKTSPPSGSKGAETYSGEGYLIPNDLTNTQKRNVQTLITQLKDKNAFKNNDTE